MLNKSTSRSKYVVQSGVTQYPIGFEFFSNGDDTPQIRVTIGAMVAEENLHFVISEDLLTINLIPLEEEAPVDPNDYSWMDKWVGMELVIERDIPFVQESDYQLGRISPERIEKDFDLSVMRDQILADQIKEHTDDVQVEIDALHSRIDFVQEEHVLDMAAVDRTLATKATKDELENAKTTLYVGIQGNAQAIQKTREDMNAKDSEIETILNDHTERLNTLRTDHDDLGDDVSDIQAKIATKQDQLTAGDNIIISNNVISATGAGGGAGLDMVVVDQLPETGQKGIIYLVKKDGAAPDIHDEYVWIESTQSFELIGTTQVDLSGYAKKTYVDSADQQLKVNQDSLYANQVVLSGMLNTKDADGNWTTLTTTAQTAIPAINELNESKASKEDLSGYLPLSGGALTGALSFDTIDVWGASRSFIFRTDGTCLAFEESYQGGEANHRWLFSGNRILCENNSGYATNFFIGSSAAPLFELWTQHIGTKNGQEIIVPTEGGTIARIEDIDAAVGDISTALTAILGE